MKNLIYLSLALLAVPILHAQSIVLPRTNSITPVEGCMPAWWRGPDICSANDGIPDAWKRFTHTEGYAAHEDPDEDDLNMLGEFWVGSDPLLSHTMGHFLSDGELVRLWRDPRLPLDWTANETTTNGFINIWVNEWGNIPSKWFYGFSNRGDGFDGTYALSMPAASAHNCDVLVSVKSTRSVLLDYGGNGSKTGIVLLGDANIKLRVPFGDKTRLSLLPYPDADTEAPHPEALDGELWKASMTVAFAPRGGQYVDIEGILVSRVSNAEINFGSLDQINESITTAFFPQTGGATASSPSHGGGMRLLSSGGGNDGGPFVFPNRPATEIEKSRRIAITPPSGPFFAGGTYGPFTTENSVGINTANVFWKASNGGTMNPLKRSPFSFLTIPTSPQSGTITVTAEAYVGLEVFYPVSVDIPYTTPADELLVDLIIERTPLTLMDTTNTYTVVVSNITQNTTASASDYRIHIRRASEGNKHLLHQSTDSVTKPLWAAGYFKLTGSAKIDGEWVNSYEKDLEIRFPSLAEFMSLPHLLAAFNALWEATKAYSDNNPDLICEYAFFITLDTSTGIFTNTPIQSKEGVDKDDFPQWTPVRPPDNPTDPTPLGTAVYVVADFHTHPSSVNRTTKREVGPSEVDYNGSNKQKLPGLVFDYTATMPATTNAPNGEIPAHHPRDAGAKIYEIPFTHENETYTRRLTPQ